jgi:hypothetical protein
MSVKTTRKHSWPCNYTAFKCEGVGATIKEYSDVERIMSDVYADVGYALIWDAELGAPRSIRLWTEGFSADGSNVVTIDATPEVLAAYEAYKSAKAAEKRAEEAARYAAIEAARAKEPRRDRTVKVVRGRKVPKGTVGVCIWIGAGDYGPRCGLKTADGEVYWTALGNVEAVVEAA